MSLNHIKISYFLAPNCQKKSPILATHTHTDPQSWTMSGTSSMGTSMVSMSCLPPGSSSQECKI